MLIQFQSVTREMRSVGSGIFVECVLESLAQPAGRAKLGL